MTREQCRAARELLGWTVQKLAVEAHCSLKTVERWELGAHRSHLSTALAISAALRAAGAEFTDDPPGVRFQKVSASSTHGQGWEALRAGS